MKAAQIKEYGSYEQIEVNPNAPEPKLKANQVLVKVKSASLNPFDWKLRAGFMKDIIPLTLPFVLGGDFSGLVLKVGENAGGYKEGDEVYGTSNVANGGSGSLAEFTAANTGNIAKKPHDLDFETAAALPLVGASTVQALEDHIKMQAGQKILIHGGAGGIGSIAIQLAKYLGAYVVATAGTGDLQHVKQLGADEVIDYKKEDFSQKLQGFDAVYDTVGGETTVKSFKVLKKGGILISMLGQPDENLAKQYDVTAIGQGTKTDTKHLNRLTELVEKGAVKPQVAKIFSLDDAKDAFKYQEENHPRGKVVIKIN